MTKHTCSVEECRSDVLAKSLCRKHYKRMQKHGTTDAQRLTAEQRFWSKVDKAAGECWRWTGALDSHGYGSFSHEGKTLKSHRYALALNTEPPSSDAVVDHTCWNRACVNPDHLRWATVKQNAENHTGPSVANKSGIRGVFWHSARKKWYARVVNNGIQYHGGSFDSIAEAEAAVIELRNKIHTHNDLDRAA